MSAITTEGQQVYYILDEIGRRKIDGLLDNGEKILGAPLPPLPPFSSALVLTVEGQRVFEILDETGRRRILQLLDDGTIILPGGAAFTITDSIGLSDTVLSHKTVQLTDAVSLIESLFLDKAFQISEDITATDAVYRSREVIIEETITLVEEIIKVIGLWMTVEDSVALTDAVSKLATISISDNIQLTDSMLTHKLIQILEAINCVEAILTSIVPLKEVTDTIVLLDYIGLILKKWYARLTETGWEGRMTE